MGGLKTCMSWEQNIRETAVLHLFHVLYYHNACFSEVVFNLLLSAMELCTLNDSYNK